MSVNIKVGLNIEWGQIDPKVTGGLKKITNNKAAVPTRGYHIQRALPSLICSYWMD